MTGGAIPVEQLLADGSFDCLMKLAREKDPPATKVCSNLQLI